MICLLFCYQILCRFLGRFFYFFIFFIFYILCIYRSLLALHNTIFLSTIQSLILSLTIRYLYVILLSLTLGWVLILRVSLHFLDRLLPNVVPSYFFGFDWVYLVYRLTPWQQEKAILCYTRWSLSYQHANSHRVPNQIPWIEKGNLLIHQLLSLSVQFYEAFKHSSLTLINQELCRLIWIQQRITSMYPNEQLQEVIQKDSRIKSRK